MNPKEKAHELVNKMGMGNSYQNVTDTMWGLVPNNKYRHLCALKTVDEILKLDVPVMDGQDSRPFWEEVKQEIKKL